MPARSPGSGIYSSGVPVGCSKGGFVPKQRHLQQIFASPRLCLCEGQGAAVEAEGLFAVTGAS